MNVVIFVPSHRARAKTVGEPMVDYEPWLARLAEPKGHHWREDMPFSFDIPEGWAEAPALARALTLLDTWARTDNSMAPWLAFPTILRRMAITTTPLPCLVTGDLGQRYVLDARPALFKRLLKQLRRSAETGLARLERLEETVQRGGAAIAAERRPGALAQLGRLALTHPCLAARSLAPKLNLTISGAGKLLERATRLGLLVETSGRETWRTYVAPDVALTLGLIKPERGRPRALPRSTPALDGVLSDFDAEMAAINARLEGLGMTFASAPDDTGDD